MQVDQIRLTDILKQDQTAPGDGISSKMTVGANEEKVSGELRAIFMDQPVYNKIFLMGNSVAEQLQQGLMQETDAQTLHNQMAVYAHTISAEDYRQMQEDGFDPMDMEAHTIVTVTDRIKVALAKGGADVEKLGGISDAKIEAMTDGAGQKAQLERAIEGRDVPVDDTLLQEAETAMRKGQELTDPLSQDSVKYMMKQELTPTIDHVYQACFAAGGGASAVSGQMGSDVVNDLPDQLRQQMEAVITQAGLEVDAQTTADCVWMMENDIPVTSEHLTYLQELRGMELPVSEEVLTKRIADAVAQGERPGDAMLIPGYSPMERAEQTYQQQQEALNQITAARQREEARLMLSVQANYTLLSKGVAIDTMAIEEVVTQLQSLEESYISYLTGAETPEDVKRNVETYQTFTQQVDEMKTMPAALLGQLPDITRRTVAQINEAGNGQKDTYEKAQQRYETLWTAPRRDLGDSIQKAFANVDDILEDLSLETTEANRRAVRILAYNEMELTEENISRIRSTDESVQRMFRSMTPAVVTQMIREGRNPLDLSVQELTDTADQMMQEQGSNTPAEKYAAYLWQLEHTGDITETERESYIGIYRLIHQVQAGDGAAVGALIAQGTDVTLRNLMTAVRSGKHSGREYAIDDQFGALESFDKETLSITDQIEMAFQANCLYDAGDEMTPVRMKRFGGEEAYMDLTPEQFRDQLQDMADEAVIQQEKQQQDAYAQQVRQTVAQALESEEEIYRILERYDIPETPAYLLGLSEMRRDRNSVFRNLSSYATSNDQEQVTISDLIEDLIEDYGEAIKTPEEMAEAQHKLEETAENVMKNMLVEKDVTSIDVRGMKLVMTQIQALGQMAKHSETYHIPILVEDEVGDLSLKIVRGTEKKGLVDVALSMEQTGAVHGSFRYEAGEISGEVTFERKELTQMFSEQMPYLAQNMQEETGMPISFVCGQDRHATDDVFAELPAPEFEITQEQDSVTTQALYGVARSFIRTLREFLA